MPWGRLDDQANGNAKLLALSDAAWRMWGAGLIYCQANLTNGFIPTHAIDSFGVRAKNKAAIAAELCRSLVPGKKPLWNQVEGGYAVHDYLDWNDSRDTVLAERASAKARIALVRDPRLRKALRERDGDSCRYCGETVNWSDRKGVKGATYDHVDPKGPDTLDNLVICCRSCNSKKGARTPEEAGITLRGSRSDLDLFETKSRPSSSTHVPQPQVPQAKERLSAPPDESDRRKAHPIRDLIDFYSRSYLATVGAKPRIAQKDPAIFENLLKQHDAETVQGALAAFMADTYAKQVGFPIGLFASQFNRHLAASVKPAPKGDWYGHIPHCTSKADCTVRMLDEARAKREAEAKSA